MLFLLLVSLTAEPALIFEQPILKSLQTQYPDAICLDIDSFSDNYLISRAVQLLQEAGQYIICFNSEGAEIGFNNCRVILEELIRQEKPGLVILQGEHKRLAAILSARASIKFVSVNAEEEVMPAVSNFLTD